MYGLILDPINWCPSPGQGGILKEKIRINIIV